MKEETNLFQIRNCLNIFMHDSEILLGRKLRNIYYILEQTFHLKVYFQYFQIYILSTNIYICICFTYCVLSIYVCTSMLHGPPLPSYFYSPIVIGTFWQRSHQFKLIYIVKEKYMYSFDCQMNAQVKILEYLHWKIKNKIYRKV